MNDQDSLFKDPAAPATPAPAPADLSSELRATRRDLSNVLLMMLVISGTFMFHLLQQVRYDRADLVGLRVQELQLPQARQLISEYNQRSVPAMRSFMQQLTNYARANPDVMPVLKKYGLNPAGTTPALPTTPAP